MRPLLEFQSKHAGMGSLEFTPHINSKYHIELTQPTTDTKYLLPPIKVNGVVLRLDHANQDFLMFEISPSIEYPQSDLYLRLQMRGKVYKMATAVARKNLKIKVPIDDLPQGIAEVTLFNHEMMPLCERLVYLNQERQLFINTTLAESYKTRDKVTIEIVVSDQKGQPVIAHFGGQYP